MSGRRWVEILIALLVPGGTFVLLAWLAARAVLGAEGESRRAAAARRMTPSAGRSLVPGPSGPVRQAC